MPVVTSTSRPVIQVGSTAGYDFGTFKFQGNGDTSWVRLYDSPWGRWDYATDIEVDAQGNVYIAGWSWTMTDQDMLIVKYSPAGDTLWTARYTSGVDQRDETTAMTIDDDGNVYAVAKSWINGTWDWRTVKFSSDGDTLWSGTYDGPAGNTDVPWDILADSNGDVFVTGSAFYEGASYTRAALVKYDANGVEQFARIYAGEGTLSSETRYIAMDGAGFVYLAGIRWTGSVSEGHSGWDSQLAKINPSTGDTLWMRHYDGPYRHRDSVHAVYIDPDANIYLAGASYRSPWDWVQVLKYDSAGTLLWEAHSDPTGTHYDKARAVWGMGDNAFVAGFRTWDWLVMKFGPDSSCCTGPSVGNLDGSPDNMITLGDLTVMLDLLFISFEEPGLYGRGQRRHGRPEPALTRRSDGAD